MIRTIAMLGLVAGMLALAGCDLCSDCDSAPATDGASVDVTDGGGSALAADLHAGAASDAAVCPMSALDGECGDMAKDCGTAKDCDAMEDCSGMEECSEMEDCSDMPCATEKQCSEKAPAAPAVQD